MALHSISLRLAWRNLWRHKRRTWLTLGAMIFCNLLLAFMVTLQIGSYSMMIDNTLRSFVGHLQIQQTDYLKDPKMRSVVPEIADVAELARRALNTQSVAARASGFAMASSAERSFGILITGVQPDFEPKVSSLPGLVTQGRYLTTGAHNEVVIGKLLARNLKVGIGDEITLMGGGYDGSIAAAIVTVVGILESGMGELDRSIAQLSLSDFQEIFAMPGKGHSVVIGAPDLVSVAPWKEKLSTALVDYPGLVVRDWDELQPGLRQAITADMSSSLFMYLVLVVLVAFSVLNTQLMSVLERTREFGIMMALGLKPSRLSRLVLIETSLMALLGLCLGVFLGFLLVWYLSLNGFSYPGMDEMAEKFNMPARIYPELSLLTLLPGPLVVSAGSLLAALYPALRIFKLQPVEAMRAV